MSLVHPDVLVRHNWEPLVEDHVGVVLRLDLLEAGVRVPKDFLDLALAGLHIDLCGGHIVSGISRSSALFQITGAGAQR
jgi:hypothetical protein